MRRREGRTTARATRARLGSCALLLAACSVAPVARPLPGPTSAAPTSSGATTRATTPPVVDAAPAASATAGAPRARDASAAAPTADGRRRVLERHGVTWTFARPARCGRYVNGDWWVVGPIDVVAIHPRSIERDGRVLNGSMIDPSPIGGRQGYDSAMRGGDARGGARFDPTANVAIGVVPERPLRLAADSSLVSSVSDPSPGALPQLESCAVLTCVSEAPPSDAFRPPYCGAGSRRARWLARELDLTRLATLAAEPGAPALPVLVARFERTWLDHLPGLAGRYLHPRANMPDYGRDLAELVSRGALALQLDVPLDQKRPLAVAMTQLGLDVYGVVRAGGDFAADSGNGSGRKFPLVLAGALLGDDDLLETARERRFAFGEDAQTFHVARTAPGIWNHGHGGYGADDDGMPEWGVRHHRDPSRDRKGWSADPYRRCCTANGWVGFVLAARAMALHDAWGHPALFDYMDRYMQVETPGHWMRSTDRFSERMWDRYRAWL